MAQQGDNSVMRGWLFKAALFAALLTVPAWAQHGGAGGGGGHGGGFGGGGHAGGFSGGGHAGGFAGSGAHGGFSSGPTFSHAGAWNGNRSWNGWHGNGWNNWNNNWRGNGWRNRGWGWPGYGWVYPYWGYYPGWGWYGDGWYDSSFDDNEAQQPAYAPSYPTQMYMAPDGTLQATPPDQAQQQQIYQLQGEVAQLKAGIVNGSIKVATKSPA